MITKIIISFRGCRHPDNKGTKILHVLFLSMFFHVPFNLELLSTNVTDLSLYKCSFMCKRHLKHINVKSVENNSRENIESQNTCKKSTSIFWILKRYQDSRHLLQNPKVPKNVMGFNNHVHRSTLPYYLDLDILPKSWGQ